MCSGSHKALMAACAMGALLGACQREERDQRPSPVASETREQVALTTNSAGPSPPEIRVSAGASNGSSTVATRRPSGLQTGASPLSSAIGAPSANQSQLPVSSV